MLALFRDPISGQTVPMIYGGKIQYERSYTFETLNIETGIWTELGATSMGQPYLTTLFPLGGYQNAREGALVYYDIAEDPEDIHIFSDGKWGRTEAKAARGLLGGSWETLVPRSFICG